MGILERKSYLLAIMLRYANSTRSEKSAILDEFCAVCNYNRKYAIRILGKKSVKPNPKRGPKPIYQDEDFLEVLKTIWFAADQPCSRKLKAIIPLWLPSYEILNGKLPESTKHKLLRISSATIDRILKPVRALNKTKGRCTTKPGSLLKSQIEIQFSHWDIKKPGFIEADTVAHCGDNIGGQFAWSLTATDICTGWTENRALWNKNSGAVYQEISGIEGVLPFDILGFDSDNGTEFMNHALHDYFTKRENPVLFTRSRPYRKNDNAHVEQKNWTHVRQLFGYDRLDDRRVVDRMNDLYRHEWSLYQNHFMPTMKLLHKQRIGSKYKKIYEKPQTPYERVLASPFVEESVKLRLKAVHERLNPFTLKSEIERKLEGVFKLVKVTSNVRLRI